MSSSCSSTLCSHPGKLRCGGCLSVSYCGKECQKANWKSHKQVCSSAQKASSHKASTQKTPTQEASSEETFTQKTYIPEALTQESSASKYNCIVVRASSLSATAILENTTSITEQLEPLHLQSYGSEVAEIRELKQRLG